MKICSRCKIEKDESEFLKESRRPSGLRSHCKECNRLYFRNRYSENKETVLAENKKYREANKDKINEYFRKRRQDPNYKLAANLRSRTSVLVRRKLKGQKNYSAIKNLGCSVDQFISHLESKFKNGMSWNNYGEWELDHIIPLSSITEENYNRLIHYTNIQPLWKNDNIIKSNKELLNEQG